MPKVSRLYQARRSDATGVPDAEGRPTTSVVIIDAEDEGRADLEALLSDVDPEIHLRGFPSPTHAWDWIRAVRPDILLLVSPDLDAEALWFLRVLRSLPEGADVPLLIATRELDGSACSLALELGRTDFLDYPIKRRQAVVRCHNLLSLSSQQRSLEGRARWLATEFRHTERKLTEREQETLLRLARAGEFRDSDTGDHLMRMAKYSRLIAETIDLPILQCEIIEHSAPMHDIGKIGVPDHILLKPSKLSPNEASIMRGHAQIGYEILKDSQSCYLQAGAEIAYFHHERFDGSGYPNGLRGSEIPIAARIVAVADVFDALVSERPYKQAWSLSRAFDYLVGQRNRQFDPECVDAFLAQRELVFATHQGDCARAL